MRLRNVNSPRSQGKLHYIVRHEAVQKMRVGPSEPAYRSRLQTTSSCIGKEPFVVSVEEQAWQKTVPGGDQGDGEAGE